MPHVFTQSEYAKGRKESYDFTFVFETLLRKQDKDGLRAHFTTWANKIEEGLGTHVLIALIRVPIRVRYLFPDYERAFVTAYGIMVQRHGPEATERLFVGLKDIKMEFLK